MRSSSKAPPPPNISPPPTRDTSGEDMDKAARERKNIQRNMKGRMSTILTEDRELPRNKNKKTLLG